MKPTLRMLATIILAFIFINLLPITALSAADIITKAEKTGKADKGNVEEKEEPQKQTPEEPQKELDDEAEIPIEEQKSDYADLFPMDVTNEQRERINNQLSLYLGENNETTTQILMSSFVQPGELGWRSEFKSWADYRALGRSTQNYKLCSEATADENGLLVYEGYYLVALGSGWCGELGSKFLVITEDLNIFPVMVCDEKADRHTDATNKYHRIDGSVVEFYVNANKLNEVVRYHGTVDKLPQFSGKILAVIPIEGGK